MAHQGLWTRGIKSNDFAGALTFVGIRALDPLLQYAILAKEFGTGFIPILGGSLVSQGRASEIGIPAIDSLNLSPYRLVMISMSTAAAVKQIVWRLFIGEEALPTSSSLIISLANTFASAVNSFLFVCNPTSGALSVGEGPDSPKWPGPRLLIGSTLFTVGILTELVSEMQRKAFKNKPENKGKLYTGGLFGLARHINYGGYALWRTGWALAASGWIYAGFMLGTSVYTFMREAIPELQSYCERRYGAMWQDYTKKTPYKLIPYIC